MNAYSFIEHIDSNDIEMAVINHFNELMVLYNLLGDREDIHICVEDGSISKFKLYMVSNEEALRLFDILNNAIFTIREDRYIIRMELSDNIVLTTISKAISE